MCLGYDPGLPRKYGMCTMLIILGVKLAIGLGSGGDGKGSGCVVIVSKGVKGSKGGKGVRRFVITSASAIHGIESKLSCCGLRCDKFS